MLWNNLSALQVLAVLSALLLTIGAIVEYKDKIKPIVLLIGKWIFGKSTPYDRCVLRKLLVHSVGPLMVVFGIAGELVFEGRAFIVEDRQENEARQTIGSLKDLASEAFIKAKDALSDSSAALETSQQARQEADWAKNLAESATAELADRKLTNHQVDVIAEKLKPYHGQEYEVVAYWDSKEAMGIANQVHEALKEANWSFVPLNGYHALFGGIVSIQVWRHPDADEQTTRAADSLVSALRAENLQAELHIQNPTNNPKHNKITLSVGSKR